MKYMQRLKNLRSTREFVDIANEMKAEIIANNRKAHLFDPAQVYMGAMIARIRKISIDLKNS